MSDDDRTGYARPSSAVNAAVALFCVWTGFVWGGRVRNLSGDDELVGWDLWGPMLMSASFVIGAIVVVTFLVQRWREPGDAAVARRLTMAIRGLAAWTTVVWVIRAGDIAIFGDHQVPFVVVHIVLAAVSIVLAAWAIAADRDAVADDVALSVSAG